MNKKTSLILIIIIFGLLIVFASVLYPILSKNAQRQTLVQLDTQKNETIDEQEERIGEVEQEIEVGEAEQEKSVDAVEQEESIEVAEQEEFVFMEEETAEPVVEDSEEIAEVVMVPDFVVFTENQEMVYLSDYFGKPIVLNFWASWCSPCKAEMPAFNELYLELKDEVTFLMINSTDGKKETLETASEYVKSQGFEFEVLYDLTQMASYFYQITSIPQTFFIDSKGQLVAYAKGTIDKQTLRTAIGYIQ